MVDAENKEQLMYLMGHKLWRLKINGVRMNQMIFCFVVE
jgi:hypothetical protein